ncbi:MAG: CPBP family intramembrane metalloprotease [Lachnospiraceae bacterium]|nr:CPBP family intramembrane metalloprotease [Lachnospiraceae bacterium]
MVDLVPMYAVALPVSLLIFRKVPARQGVSGSKNGVPLKAGQIVRSVFIIIFLTNAGNVVGILVTRILGALAGTSTESALGSYAMDTSVWLQILFMSVVGPFFEELIFRKLLIDRMSCYGGKLAVVTSALMFGLSHGNLSQFFYTFAMGLLCGYIYLKTGRLRYSAGLHMGINFLGVMESFVMLSMVSLPDGVGDMTVRQLVMALVMVIGIVAVVAATIIGLVMFNRARKTVLYENEPLEIPKGSRFRTAYCNIGMALFVLACVIMFVTSLI